MMTIIPVLIFRFSSYLIIFSSSSFTPFYFRSEMRFIPFLFTLVVAPGGPPGPQTSGGVAVRPHGQQTVSTRTIPTILLVGGILGVHSQKFDDLASQYFAEHFGGEVSRLYLTHSYLDNLRKFLQVCTKDVSDKFGAVLNKIISLVGDPAGSVVYWNGIARTTRGKIHYEFHEIIGILELLAIAEKSVPLGKAVPFVNRILTEMDTATSVEMAEWNAKIEALVNGWHNGLGPEQSSNLAGVPEWRTVSLKIISRANWVSKDQAVANREKLFSLISDDGFNRVRLICSKSFPFHPVACTALISLVKSVVENIDNLLREALKTSADSITDYGSTLDDVTERLDFLFRATGKLQSDLPLIVGVMKKMGRSDFFDGKGFIVTESTSSCSASKVVDRMIGILPRAFTIAARDRAGFDQIRANYPDSIGEDRAQFCSGEYPDAATEGALSSVKRAVLCYNSVTSSDPSSAAIQEECSRIHTYFSGLLDGKLATL